MSAGESTSDTFGAMTPHFLWEEWPRYSETVTQNRTGPGADFTPSNFTFACQATRERNPMPAAAVAARMFNTKQHLSERSLMYDCKPQREAPTHRTGRV